MPQVECTPDYSVCTYNTVTLNAGDTFILPENSVIIAASDPGAITSVDNCADLTQLETPICYGFRLSGSTDTASESQNWESFSEDESFLIYGVVINNKRIGFPSGGINPDNTGAYASRFAEIPSYGSLITNLQTVLAYDTDAGWTIRVSFKTIPSVGDGMRVMLLTSTNWQDPNGTTYADAVVWRYNEVGDQFFPECS